MSEKFIKGLELNEGYYFDIVQPLIISNYPNLKHSAGLIGYGSDVVGFDTEISMDHNWGPRLIIFLSEKDTNQYKCKIDNLFRKKLPYEYKGFPTNFSDPENDGVQKMKKIEGGQVNHLIEITSINVFLNNSLGIRKIKNLKLTDWLKFSDQGLIEVTKGKVFYDGLNQLKDVRNYLEFYPKDILRLKLASLWNYIAYEEAFIGRNVDLGEKLGVKFISSRIVNILIKICFYLESEYIPYSKWFTRSFKKLNCYKEVNKLFMEIINCENMSVIDELMCKAYQKVVTLQNELMLTEEIKLSINDYYGRPYKVVFTEKIVRCLVDSITDKELKTINLDYVSLIQNINGIDLTDNKDLYYKLF